MVLERRNQRRCGLDFADFTERLGRDNPHPRNAVGQAADEPAAGASVAEPAQHIGCPHPYVGRFVVEQLEHRVDREFAQVLQPGGGGSGNLVVLVFKRAGQGCGGTAVLDPAQRVGRREPDPGVGVAERLDECVDRGRVAERAEHFRGRSPDRRFFIGEQFYQRQD